MASARAAIAIVLGASFAVTGCATQLPPPSGLTENEIAAFEKSQADQFWKSAQLPADTPRPITKIVRYLHLEAADWGTTMVACMKAAGFADYVADSGGGMRFVGTLPQSATDRKLAMYVCQTEYPYDPVDYQVLSAQQRDYLYSYFVRWLVPCLELRGYNVLTPPTRADFVSSAPSGGWNPYVGLRFPTDPAEMARLSDECPSTPDGLYPRVTASSFQR
jgi:hypothetical protein